MSRPWAIVALGAIGLAAAGCTEPLETGYGRTRGRSVNGTGALAEWLRAEGHTVRAAVRLTDELREWADAIVRFAPYPGPPARDEAEWYQEWLVDDPDRFLVYVVRDYDAEADYWVGVLGHLPAGADSDRRRQAETSRADAARWPDHRPSAASEPADPDAWFAVLPAKGPPETCRRLSGPWAEGIDAGRAALTRHQALRVGSEWALLEGDGATLAMAWAFEDRGGVLAIANGAFLLNAALANPARRPLAGRVVEWIGEPGPRRVAFVEGELGKGPPTTPSPLALLGVPPFGWIVAHLFAFGLIACLVRAVRLGRPRPEPPDDAERPAAHPEAIGALLERVGDADAARDTLETYRRWRQPSAHPPRPRAPHP